MTNPVYLPNPDYGSGVYCRAVRLTNRPGTVEGELEDTMHAMRCVISHDGGAITSAESEFMRIPMTTCSGAAAPLRELVGLPLSTSEREFFGGGRARRNCTHIFDLAWWMIAHARRTESVRLYEVVIPDQQADAPYVAEVWRNDEPALRWTIVDHVIQAPPPYAGQAVLRGFSAWAVEALAGDELEAAQILQRGCFVAQSRRIDTRAMLGPLTPNEAAHRGVCWSFASPQFEQAVRIDSSRTFSGRGDLLRSSQPS